MKRKEGIIGGERISPEKLRPEDISFVDLTKLVQLIRAQAMRAIEDRFTRLLEKAEQDFNNALQKYQANLAKIESRRLETNDEKQAEHDIDYAQQILAKDIEDIKNSIRKNLPTNN